MNPLDQAYALAITLTATQFAIREAHNRREAQRLFKQARSIRRQLREA